MTADLSWVMFAGAGLVAALVLAGSARRWLHAADQLRVEALSCVDRRELRYAITEPVFAPAGQGHVVRGDFRAKARLAGSQSTRPRAAARRRDLPVAA